MNEHIAYQPGNARAKSGGAGKRLARAQAALEKLRLDQEQGFFELPWQTAANKEIEALAKKVRRDCETMLVVGIGGSNLGAKTIYRALGGEGCRLIFLDTPDPDALAAWQNCSKTEWARTAVLVISKSGTTLETLAIFLTLQQERLKALGPKEAAKHVYVITEPTANPLFDLARQHGYNIIKHPLNVGGRYSVLSAVGLFPAACAGADIQALVRGARGVEEERRRLGGRCAAAQFAWNHYALGRRQPIQVLMTYAKRLNEFGQWYRQLWAESLGKDGTGPTPVAATGPTDQHSQIQLYQEGPKDKIVTFLSTKRFGSEGRVPKTSDPKLAFMSGQKLDKIMRAEMTGTMRALQQVCRPADWLEVKRIDAESLGALFQFFMTAVTFYAQLADVDAFNQPGVEAGKKLARKLLPSL